MAEKTLVQKLLIKPGKSVRFVNAPRGYDALLGPLPEKTVRVGHPTEKVDFIQAFIENREELEETLPSLIDTLKPNGILWVTFHKTTARFRTDINRDSINAYAKTIGLQGVAIVAVDENWSALRLKPIE